LLLGVPLLVSAFIHVLPIYAWRLSYGQPAVYVEYDALDVAGLLARQKQRRPRDVLWHAHTSGGDGGRHTSPRIGISEAEGLVREWRARRPWRQLRRESWPLPALFPRSNRLRARRALVVCSLASPSLAFRPNCLYNNTDRSVCKPTG
jgi:hypothetical protein